MKQYKREFIQFCIQNSILQFGQFTLKSGRESPYFFNTGLFNTGRSVARLGQFYAEALQHSSISFDILFGPAYKGIPLVVTTAIALFHHFQKNIPFCFNRKAIKDHGEGGNFVGAPLQGKVLIIDDVITAGTSIHESAKMIQSVSAELVGVCIALDRQEKGQNEQSAVIDIQQIYGIPVISVVTLQDLIAYIRETPSLSSYLEPILHYREKYGV